MARIAIIMYMSTIVSGHKHVRTQACVGTHKHAWAQSLGFHGHTISALRTLLLCCLHATIFVFLILLSSSYLAKRSNIHIIITDMNMN